MAVHSIQDRSALEGPTILGGGVVVWLRIRHHDPLLARSRSDLDE
jgi:hypothetical protein